MINQKGFTHIIIAILSFVAAAVVFLGVWWFFFGNSDDTATNTDAATVIDSFEDCIAAGNPAMESYPRQCSVEGVTFTEVITNTNVELNQNVNSEANTSTTVEVDTNTSTADNWETYTNQTQGWSIQYPSNALIVRTDTTTGAEDENGWQTSFWNRADYMDFMPLASEGYPDDIYAVGVTYQSDDSNSVLEAPEVSLISSEEITVDGVIGTKEIFEGPYGQWTSVYLKNNGVQYRITLPDKNTEQLAYGSELLETFQFTN
ncbi:hypothetical protein KJ810_04090 [Patescibacteria group bacterium]|nr:hypothetical protein [Patescibacteria group bacterium]